MTLDDYGQQRAKDFLSFLQTRYNLKDRGFCGAVEDLLVDVCRADESESVSIDLVGVARGARRIYLEMYVL